MLSLINLINRINTNISRTCVDRKQYFIKVLFSFIVKNYPQGNLDTFSSTACVFIKVKVKVKFTLEQATKAQRGSRGIALLFS
jgi:hypothetical protein